MRDADGKITLVVDPEAIGNTKLTVSQAPNGAYTGTVFEFDVTVKPNPQIAPEASRGRDLARPRRASDRPSRWFRCTPLCSVLRGQPVSDRGSPRAGKKNAERKGDDTTGHYTDFTYVFKPSDADFLVPDAT